MNKQAPRALFSKLSSWLITYDFTTSLADPSLIILPIDDLWMFILVYVDDMIITSSFSFVATHLISSPGKAFPIKDLGRLSYFLGVKLDHLPTGILLTQHIYISDLLQKIGLSGANAVSSPMAASVSLSKFDSPTFENLTLFLNIVGSLQ